MAAIEFAHDFNINGGMEGLSGEGTEVYAMFSGTVVNNGIAVPTNPDNYKEVIGSRDRDIVATGCRGACTPHQGEIYIQHYAGSDPVYREGFVSYYAHLRRRLVVDGQTVKAGQLIGFMGRSGAAGGPHLHIGVFRTSNSNAHQVGNLQRGYHVNFQTTTSVVNPSGNNQSNFNAIDFFGWANGSAFDPSAYVDWNTDTGLQFLGKGAWSANLFKPNESPHDP